MMMELVSEPKATADVWEHFGFKPNDRGEPQNINEPVCHIRFKTVYAKHGNTTNTHHHLKHNHPLRFSQLGKKHVYQKKQRGRQRLPDTPPSLGLL